MWMKSEMTTRMTKVYLMDDGDGGSGDEKVIMVT